MSIPSTVPLISVVTPVYLAEDIVDAFVERTSEAVAALGDYEIVMVDDRSPDGSWDRIREAAGRDSHVRGVRLSRNFGQHAAIAAGLEAARGDHVVVIDCDLQDDPAHIPQLLAAAEAGADVVLTRHADRRHGRTRNVASRLYLGLNRWLTDSESELGDVGSFSLLTRRVVDAYREIDDAHAHYLVVLRHLGFEQVKVDVPHHERYAGTSSYSVRKLVHAALDGVVANSTRLLNVVVGSGFALVVLALLGAVYVLASYLVRGALPGFTSIMVVLLLMTGAILMSVGVVGLYVGRILEQTRGRQRWVVDTVVGRCAERPSATSSDTTVDGGDAS